MNLTKKISIIILDNLILNDEIEKKKYEKTLYGIEILISALLQVTGLIILGVLLGILNKMIPVVLGFALLRMFAGGYHASTCLKCFITTFLMCVVSIKLADFVGSITGVVVMIIGTLLLVIKFAPKDSSYKRMTIKEKIINKRRSIITLLTLSSISTYIYIYNPSLRLYSVLIVIGFFLESLSLLIRTD